MTHNNFDMSQLKPLGIDQAYVTFTSFLNETVSLYTISDSCEECPEYFLHALKSQQNKTFVMAATYVQYISVKLKKKVICSFTENFSEYGSYLIEIFYDNNNGQARCSETMFINFIDNNYTDESIIVHSFLNLISQNPFNFDPITFHFLYKQVVSLNFIAIFSVLSILYFLPSIIQFVHHCINKVKNYLMPLPDSNFNDMEASIPNENKISKPKYRLISLDVFRGLNIILMLFVNSGGGGYTFFKHPIWHGMNFAELPHGWFNWIMGMSVALSGSYDRQTITAGQRMKRTIQRTTKLIFLGLVVSSVNFTSNLDQIPYFGVLQDLGILYSLAVFLDIILPRKQQTEKNVKKFFFMDCNFLWPQWLVLILAAIVHNSLLFGFNVPNCGRGYLGPGGRHLNSKYKLCTGGAAGYIDRFLMQNKHLAFGIQFVHVYKTEQTFDPYGPFGLIGQIVQMYFGILAGEMFLLRRDKPKSVFKRWLFLSFVLCSLSFALCNTPLDYCFVPCSRKLWTLTYTCYICSSAFFLMSALYCIIDVQKWWNGWPIICPGTNSVFLYVGHVCLRTKFPFEWPTPKTHYHLLFKHLWQVFLWTLISAVMYHKKMFLTV